MLFLSFELSPITVPLLVRLLAENSVGLWPQPPVMLLVETDCRVSIGGIVGLPNVTPRGFCSIAIASAQGPATLR